MAELSGNITIAKAAELMGVTKRRMHQLVETYGLNTIAVGNLYLVQRSDVMKLKRRDRKNGRPKDVRGGGAKPNGRKAAK